MPGPSVDDNYGTSRSIDGHSLATAVTTIGHRVTLRPPSSSWPRWERRRPPSPDYTRLVTRQRRGRDRTHGDADQVLRRDYGSRRWSRYPGLLYTDPPLQEASSMGIGASPRSVPGAGARATTLGAYGPTSFSGSEGRSTHPGGLISPVASPTDALTELDDAGQYIYTVQGVVQY